MICGRNGEVTPSHAAQKGLLSKSAAISIIKKKKWQKKIFAVSFGVNPGSGPLKMGQQTTGNGPTQTSDTKL